MCCHLCSFLSPLNHCVYKIVCNQWAARCGFEEPSFVTEALYATVRHQHRYLDQAAETFFTFSLDPAPWWTGAPVTSIIAIQCHAILCLYQINQKQKKSELLDSPDDDVLYVCMSEQHLPSVDSRTTKVTAINENMIVTAWKKIITIWMLHQRWYV